MKIVKGHPPNIEEIKKHFPISANTVFTYGDTIYVSGDGAIPRHLEKHEETHMQQQKNYPDVWWSKYFTDTQFRMQQELEAYRRQYQEFCVWNKDRNVRYRFLLHVAADFGSPLYGKIITPTEAAKRISQ